MMLEVLSDARIGRLGSSELVQRIAETQAMIDRAIGYRQKLVAAARKRQSEGSHGDTSIVDDMTRATGVSRHKARRMLRQAENISHHTEVSDALTAGDINPEQADSLAKARVPDKVRADLLHQATREGADLTKRRIREAERAHDTETAEQRFERQHRNRRLRSWTDNEGMRRFEAALDPVAGAHANNAITALAQRLWRADKHLVAVRRRTPSQRDADAFTQLLTNANASGPSDSGPATPNTTLRVTISFDDLRQAVDATLGADGSTPAGITDAGERLDAASIRRLACEADVIPVVLGSPGRVVDVGRRQRTVRPAQRNALIIRDRGCVWPDCDAPPARCDAHHVTHWSNGGPTNLANLALLCHQHHTLVHEGGHALLAKSGGGWQVRYANASAVPPKRAGPRELAQPPSTQHSYMITREHREIGSRASPHTPSTQHTPVNS